jgi:dCTP deaminase
MMLSDFEIARYRERGVIVIEPFRPEALSTNSYDLTVGPHVARYKRVPHGMASSVEGRDTPLVDFGVVSGADLFDVEDYRDSGQFMIRAGESLLCHTNEFVGGTIVEHVGAVNTQLKATSTAGRYGLTACRCAGHGDVGYVNRWTLEVQNNSPFDVTIPVGSIICQIVFFEVAVPQKDYVHRSGNYQPPWDHERLQQEWAPTQMLPKKLKKTDFWKVLYDRK